MRLSAGFLPTLAKGSVAPIKGMASMSNDTGTQDAYKQLGGVSSDSARNIGHSDAHNGRNMTGQQWNEDASSFAARQNAFNIEQQRLADERKKSG
jgi:hypothetical protein